MNSASEACHKFFFWISFNPREKKKINFLISPHQCRQRSSDRPPAPNTRTIARRCSYRGQHIILSPRLSLLPVAQHACEVGKYQSPPHRTTEKQRPSLRLLIEFSHLGRENSVLKSKIPIWVTPRVSRFPVWCGSCPGSATWHLRALLAQHQDTKLLRKPYWEPKITITWMGQLFLRPLHQGHLGCDAHQQD